MRTFVSIEVTNKQVIDAIKKFQSQLQINANPVTSKNFHYTLQFLGNISEDVLKDVINSIEEIKFSKFNINLKGVGVFPNSKFPRIVWIGTGEKDGEQMINLASKVEKALKPIGFLPDKKFKPHLTVFRIKRKIGDISKELADKENMDFGTQIVTSIKLKKSELTPSGPNYSDLLEVKAI